MTGTGHLWRCLRGGGWRLGRGPFSRQRRVGRSSRSFCWSRRFSFVVFVFFWSCFVIRSRREVFWGSYTPPRRMERRMDRRYRERSRVQHPIDLESRSPMAWQHRDFNYQQHSTFHDRYPGRHIGDNNRSRRVHVQILDKILFY